MLPGGNGTDQYIIGRAGAGALRSSVGGGRRPGRRPLGDLPLQLAAASGPLNCGYDQAGSVLLERPEKYDPQPSAVPAGAVTLDAGQIQDLAVLVPRLLEESAGYALRFKMNVELAPHPGARAALDRLLAEVSGTLVTSEASGGARGLGSRGRS